ncbi:mitochondrial substrate carrier family protein B-like protein, partial [Tanacetum coccineum]
MNSNMQTEARVRVRPVQRSEIGAVSQLIAGGVAGAVSKTCTAPLARLTILFQVQGMHSDVATLRKASIWREASRIVNEEGFRAFWKGNLVTIAHHSKKSHRVCQEKQRAFKKQKTSKPTIIENQITPPDSDLVKHGVGKGLMAVRRLASQPVRSH